MRLFFGALLIVCCFTILSNSPTTETDYSKEIDRYYSTQLDTLEQDIIKLKNLIEKHAGNKMLKNQFMQTRLSYKKLSVITDYFNPYETILLNSPALQRTEDDNPTKIIDPHGFQKLEEIIWTQKGDNTQSLLYEADYILGIIQLLEKEPDRINKFANPSVWNAIRSSLIRIITLGISGYDSPVAMLSIEEAKASLEGINKIIRIYESSFTQKEIDQYSAIQTGILNGIIFLQQAKDFNHFDRLRFIRDIINPVSNNISQAIVDLGYVMPEERRPLNPLAKNIFSPGAFDVNFFSPNDRYRATAERVSLGKKIFYDPQLSGNGIRSCATCHKPELAFTDGLPKALALDNKTPLTRNTPTLLNAVYQTKQFYDSRQTMLEFQVNNVVHSEKEMGGSIEKTAALLKTQPVYRDAFAKAYPNDTDPVTVFTIANSIASYIRSLQSLNAKFDQYMRDEPVSFSAAEKNGFNLFMGKAKCGTCHFMPMFNGLVPPGFNDTESEVLGVPLNTAKPAVPDLDSGKYYFTQSTVHLFSFKTPTVRNIALTAPYMHNGVYKTLEEVIDFYNEGGGKGLGIELENQSLPFDKLKLSKNEKKDIIAFLKTLTDTSVTSLNK